MCLQKNKREIRQEKSMRVSVCERRVWEKKTERAKEKKTMHTKRVCLQEKKDRLGIKRIWK